MVVRCFSNACIFYQDTLLLILHKKTGRWLPVGGHVEENEYFFDALLREIKEEVNLDVEVLNPSRSFLSSERHIPPFSVFSKKDSYGSSCQYFDYLAVAKDPEALKIQEEEILDYKWFSLSELESLTENINVSAKEYFLFAFRYYLKNFF